LVGVDLLFFQATVANQVLPDVALSVVQILAQDVLVLQHVEGSVPVSHYPVGELFKGGLGLVVKVWTYLLVSFSPAHAFLHLPVVVRCIGVQHRVLLHDVCYSFVLV
jgi:hypothetical protein